MEHGLRSIETFDAQIIYCAGQMFFDGCFESWPALALQVFVSK